MAGISPFFNRKCIFNAGSFSSQLCCEVYFTKHLGHFPSKTLGIQIFASSGTVGHHETDLGKNHSSTSAVVISAKTTDCPPGTLNNQFLMDGNDETTTQFSCKDVQSSN